MLPEHNRNGQYANGARGSAAANGRSTADLLPSPIPSHNTVIDTPLRDDAFARSDADKMADIEQHFRAIMQTLGLDLTDDSLRGTPRRVAKMFVQEIFSGLNPANRPAVSLFDNKYGYQQMLVERDIKVHSFCEHHFLPIYGHAHVAYMAQDKVIGLSKLNRLVDYYARRPQVQERLTEQIAAALKEVLQTTDVAVYIDARHMCVQSRGVEHEASSTISSHYSGQFMNAEVRSEFLRAIGR